MSNEHDIRFAFGENWQSYNSTVLDHRRIVLAANSLRHLYQSETLAGRTFIDVGCGSGLFSLSASLLGAAHVFSFDYDAHSVKASQSLRSRAGIKSEQWAIQQGSILDRTFVQQIESADCVYAWGVLHHTGDMWKAIDNTVSLVKPGGRLVLALYNEVEGQIGSSAMWWHVKRHYNLASPTMRRVMELTYAGLFLTRETLRGNNPVRIITDYDSNFGRGMDFWHDARDWLGGFPYEYASSEAVCTKLQTAYDFEVKLKILSDGNGCNEFMFERSPVQ